MKRVLNILVVLILLFENNYGQSSVNSTSGDFISSFGSISYSVGEVFYTSKGQVSIITEGVQHSYVINPINTKASLHISTYPNPTTDLLFFKVENLNYTELSYILYDGSGKVIVRGLILDTKTFISLKELPSSIYFLKCYRGLIEEVSFKIFKIN